MMVEITYQGYDSIKKRCDKYKADGHTLPAVSQNINGENTICVEGDADGLHFFEIKTSQHNGWVRVNRFYSDGSTEETFER